MSNEIIKHEGGSLATSEPVPSVGQMLQAVIQKGVTADSVAAVEQLVKLYERMEERDAEKAFAAAFVALQAEMPRIEATRPVPNNDGTVRYRFAPFEEIMQQISPYLKKHGFTVTFSTDFEEGRMIKHCTLIHVGGHSKANKFTVRIGSGPPRATESQADGAASTYAKRFALCDMLNIQVKGLDNDARAEGGTITPEQAKDLRTRLEHVGGDSVAFLKFAGAKTFEEISSVKLDMLEEFVAKKERLYTQKNKL